jgi:hypothetical protein
MLNYIFGILILSGLGFIFFFWKKTGTLYELNESVHNLLINKNTNPFKSAEHSRLIRKYTTVNKDEVDRSVKAYLLYFFGYVLTCGLSSPVLICILLFIYASLTDLDFQTLTSEITDTQFIIASMLLGTMNYYLFFRKRIRMAEKALDVLSTYPDK